MATSTISKVKLPDGTIYNIKDTTYTFESGSNGFTVTPSDGTAQTVSIFSNTAGATDTSDKIYLVGAPIQSGNPQTYTHDTAYVGTDGELYSDSKRVATGGARIFSGTCDTIAATVEKTVQCEDFTADDLVVGAKIFVTFTATNSGAVANLKLNVNSTGAMPIKKIYNAAINNLTNAGELRANCTYLFTYDGTNWICSGLDYNNTYTVSNNVYGATGFIADSAIYRYQLLVSIDENRLSPFTNANNVTATTKTILTNIEFNPFGHFVYYNTTTGIAAGSTISGANLAWTHTSFSLVYSFNISATVNPLTAAQYVYLQVIPLANGKVKPASAHPIAQTLPTENDGYWYILLGRAVSATNVCLFAYHPVYYHDGTTLREVGKSDNNYSDDDKTKLSAAYTHAVDNKGSAFTSGFYKITTNSEGHVTNATAVTKADITALGIPASDTTYTSKTAAQNGTDVSLVTTGEKYIWNQKTDNTGTVTSITLKAGAGISLDSTAALTTSGTRTITNSGVRAVTTGSTNGCITVNTNGTSAQVAVYGLGTAAYTSDTAYATAAQGQLADNAMPKSGGTFTGAVTLKADPTTNLGAATKQYVDNNVQISGNLGSGTEIATITINGTSTKLYSPSTGPSTISVTQTASAPTLEFITSTNTSASSTLTGVTSTTLQNGKMIVYKTAYTLSESPITLTLSNTSGTSLGNYPLYINDTIACSVPYMAGSLLFLVFYNNKWYVMNPLAIVG